MINIFLYLSYMVLIFIVLKYYQNEQRTNNTILILTVIITVGIYIINMLLSNKNIEQFYSKPNGKSCTYNTQCDSRCCGQGGTCKNEGGDVTCRAY